ncbi:MAG TPA: glycine--tRNA ligase subunit beta [Thermoanaerobaculia bacterium]|nr:glycine--tRNA ligase subunit beta [Thermoanaerobaculia bacterium]
MAEYFFELLTEEIPAWMHDAAQTAIRQQLSDVFPGAEIFVTSTPRRIVFFVKNLPLREEDREEDVKGPPRTAGEKALAGFLKKNNATMADVLDGGDYIRIRRKVTGRGSDQILQERVPKMIESLRWPKMMRWSGGEHAYIRPIHSIVSIFEQQHLPLTIFDVASGMTTVGHRTLAPGRITVTSYNDYVTKLELARVVIDATRRRHVMAERARILANAIQGTPSIDATIWAQWQYLTEYPGVLRAEFRPEYLALPEEVLVTVMRVHQKQLPIRRADEKLTNSFLAVLDNESDPDGNAAYGNAFVTNARFADAKFFYDTDRRTPLGDRLPQLTHLQFQEKLGNYLEKTKRIEAIARSICTHIGCDDKETVTAAHLCKADLVTEMVKEFTDLQGQIGGIYAREEKYPENVWQAIYDHYLPVNIEDRLPRTVSGAIVSLADKIDTLAGFFRIGARPTGSKDPFALRRAAQGIVQILLNRDKRQIRVGVDQLIDFALAAHGDATNTQVRDDLLAFFDERIRTLLEISQYGFAYDEIAAAMEAGWARSLTDLVDRVTALKRVRDTPNFLSILDSAKRIANITADHSSSRVDAAKLQDDTEKRLNELATAVGEQIDEMISERDYVRALESFAAMAPELETFFDNVMVMVDDAAVRDNRKSLLRKVGTAVLKIGDVTKIVVDRSEYRA